MRDMLVILLPSFLRFLLMPGPCQNLAVGIGGNDAMGHFAQWKARVPSKQGSNGTLQAVLALTTGTMALVMFREGKRGSDFFREISLS
ncbi:MAG: hypothetical protein ACXVB3_08015 [Flavisolibacter sp.]